MTFEQRIASQRRDLEQRGFTPCRIYLGRAERDILETRFLVYASAHKDLPVLRTYGDLPLVWVDEPSYVSVEAIGAGTIDDLIEDRNKWQEECQRLREDARLGSATIADLMESNASLVDGHTVLVGLLERAHAALDPEAPIWRDLDATLKAVNVITPTKPASATQGPEEPLP